MRTGSNLIRILAVDDHPVFREGVAAQLTDEADIALVATITIRNEFPHTHHIQRGGVTRSQSGSSNILAREFLAQRTIGNHSCRPCEIAEHATDQSLTPAEVDVLRLIAAGSANKMIADQLSITEETIKSRVKNILYKLGANGRTHAVMIGLKRGIIQLSSL